LIDRVKGTTIAVVTLGPVEAAMAHRRTLLLLFLCVLLAGCAGTQVKSDNTHSQINVFGVGLFSDVDYKEINGVSAVEEPCLRGYDRQFDALDITIGYGFNKKIRKITTRNPDTSLFSISPGAPFGEGKQKILQAGFVESAPPFTFSNNRYSLTFLVNTDNVIFGLTLESLD
jgi:hypothetical protein